MMISKPNKIRSKKLTQSARGESCTIRIPGVCNGNRETTVFAHAPSAGNGMGTKSDDFWGADACSACHQFVDGNIPKHKRQAYFFDAIYETLKRRIEKGLIKIKGA